MDQWLEITDGSFKGVKFHVALPVKGGDVFGATSVQQQSGRRLQVIKRPFQNGARIKDMGGDPRTIVVDVIFFGANYLLNLEAFKAVLNSGTSGKLVLPDEPVAINASFFKLDETSRAGESSSKTVRVTWIEDEITVATTQAVGPKVGIIPKNLLDSANKLNALVLRAKQTLNDNKVIATVRQIESLTGNVSNAFIASVGLTQDVRGRVLTTVANLTNAWDGILTATDDLLAVFGLLAAPGSGFDGGVVDAVTGNVVEDGLVPEDNIVEVNPLAPPADEPDTVVTPTSLETTEGLVAYQAEMIANLEAQTEQLQDDTDGRTADVAADNVDVINAFRDVIQSVTGVERKTIQTIVELSLAEIIFLNGIGLENIEDVLKRNSFITDPFVVPSGTVIQL